MHERRFNPSRAHLLEDPERKKWLPPDEVIAALHLRNGERVVDIGAGTGYFALPMAEAVGSGGRVVAVDVAPQMLQRLESRRAEAGVGNVQCVEGEASSTGLPSGCADVVFMANVWHEFDDHAAVLKESRRLLKPEGRLALLDWRPDAEPDHGPPVAHRIAASAAKASLQEAGLAVHDAGNVGRYSWFLIGSGAVSST
ncbi:MAG TPA: methyltransferase domain-containing protein [Acidobacteriaceae bacterium]|jgi:ubiquinone/menaquinone biosynthesis C-methylase UbiE|nr:methyltransferase domain-containing protein [Acidobacteriaceae bacterium]